jgi:CubicO group peptidase (beta-lactamase class C family)
VSHDEPRALPRSTPERQGIPSDAILSMVRRWEAHDCEPHSVMVVRHGQVVAEGWWAPYRRDGIQLLYSVSKTFLAIAVALAEDEGLLGRGERLVDVFPEAAAVAGTLASTITIEDCLRMSTGHHEDTLDTVDGFLRGGDDAARLFLAVEPQDEPGSWFLYHNGASRMLALAVQRRTGQALLDYLRPRVLDPLGISAASWRSTAGRDLGFSGLHTTTGALARLGLLLLRDGVWQGQRLLPPGWVSTATSALADTSHHPGTADWLLGYGHQMWRSRHDGFRADGAYGQFALVHPSLDLVVAVTACTDDAQPLLDAVWEELVPALSDAPRPADPDALGVLAQALRGAALPLVATAAPPAAAGPWVFTHEPTSEHPLLTRVEVRPSDDGWLLLVDDGGPQEVACGDGRWPDAVGAPFVATGGWTSPDVFEATVVAVQTPHSLRLRCADGIVTAQWRGHPLHGPCLPSLHSPGPITKSTKVSR